MKKNFHHKMSYPAAILVFILAVSCGKDGPQADAYGNFEADVVIVSAQSQGILTSLELDEGSVLKKNQLVGHIDSSTITIKKDQLRAQKTVIQARLKNLDAQIKVQEEQRINLVREVNRIEKLLKEEAATPQQYDDIQGKLKVLDTQTEALHSQKNIILAESTVLAAQIDEINNQLNKCRIIGPLEGTVLEKYVEVNELVSPGKALFKIANIEKMELKVFVSGAQLPFIAIGDSVDVLIDNTGASLQALSGQVSWISSQVEFTPKIIQTR